VQAPQAHTPTHAHTGGDGGGDGDVCAASVSLCLLSPLQLLSPACLSPTGGGGGGGRGGGLEGGSSGSSGGLELRAHLAPLECVLDGGAIEAAVNFTRQIRSVVAAVKKAKGAVRALGAHTNVDAAVARHSPLPVSALSLSALELRLTLQAGALRALAAALAPDSMLDWAQSSGMAGLLAVVAVELGDVLRAPLRVPPISMWALSREGAPVPGAAGGTGGASARQERSTGDAMPSFNAERRAQGAGLARRSTAELAAASGSLRAGGSPYTGVGIGGQPCATPALSQQASPGTEGLSLGARVLKHYSAHSTHAIASLAGHLGALGAPVALADSAAVGAQALAARVRADATQGVGALAGGLVEGVGVLLVEVVRGALAGVAASSELLRRAAEVLAAEPEEVMAMLRETQRERALRKAPAAPAAVPKGVSTRRSTGDATSDPDTGTEPGVRLGCSPLVPNAQPHALAPLGAALGAAARLPLLPLAAASAAVATLSRAASRAAASDSSERRARLPRALEPGGQLRAYDEERAEGFDLLRRLARSRSTPATNSVRSSGAEGSRVQGYGSGGAPARGDAGWVGAERHAGEYYIAHVPAASACEGVVSGILLLTSARIALVDSGGKLQWQLRASSLLGAARVGERAAVLVESGGGLGGARALHGFRRRPGNVQAGRPRGRLVVCHTGAGADLLVARARELAGVPVADLAEHPRPRSPGLQRELAGVAAEGGARGGSSRFSRALQRRIAAPPPSATAAGIIFCARARVRAALVCAAVVGHEVVRDVGGGPRAEHGCYILQLSWRQGSGGVEDCLVPRGQSAGALGRSRPGGGAEERLVLSKRYSQLAALREEVANSSLGEMALPTLPPKALFGNTSPALITARSAALGGFLVALAQLDVARPALEIFCSTNVLARLSCG